MMRYAHVATGSLIKCDRGTFEKKKKIEKDAYWLLAIRYAFASTTSA